MRSFRICRPAAGFGDYSAIWAALKKPQQGSLSVDSIFIGTRLFEVQNFRSPKSIKPPIQAGDREDR